ncbi:MAG TPA: hypothetical protein VLV86_06200 [Vicinamibacterales bacterium]|nr:hypothetical protein [Vicinamibacterales bacterium]
MLHRLLVRHKYGESVTLVDLSAGGVQFETRRVIRPDIDVVLEILNPRTQQRAHVVSRVLRANVAGLTGGIMYRAACAFRRPLSHPNLLVPASGERHRGPDYLKLELELKTIAEEYFARSREAGAALDSAPLLDALANLRSTAERRRDPIDHQLGALLAALIPALERRESTAAIVQTLRAHLADQLPLVAIYAQGADNVLARDCESITLNMCVDAHRSPIAITANFPPGFGLDASQFRLLKLSAYLVGLVETWNSQSSTDSLGVGDVDPERTSTRVAASDANSDNLPLGWHRVVLRYTDGELLHGFSNDFSPDRAFLQCSPSIGCPAGERMQVPIARLKAVFFVKDLHGDPARIDAQTFGHAPRGRRVQVTFRDGEVLMGSTLSYKPDGQGFFVMPADIAGNNVRAYVINAAIRHVRFV